MRRERCLCGGTIAAPSLAQSAPYVAAHNQSWPHNRWRVQRTIDELQAEADLLGPDGYRDPRRSTAESVTCPASASGVGGAG